VVGASGVIVLPLLIHAFEAANSARTSCFSAKGQAARTLRENPQITGDRGRLTPSEFGELKELTNEARRSAVQQLNRNCDGEYYEAREGLIHALWRDLLGKIAFPVLLAWLLICLTFWAIRWVLADNEV
jgi:hypothetical protein